ncbi:hypothetical protein GPALN_012089 [Globodera pallida]|nr:hypothetical protein GPALN_012089 [Globodera pallida]
MFRPIPVPTPAATTPPSSRSTLDGKASPSSTLHRVAALNNGAVAVPTVTVRLSADAVAAQRAAILGSEAALVKMEQFGEDADNEK